MIKILFLILLFLPARVCADGITGLSDNAIAGTIKTLAKVFVQTIDLEKVKTKHIESLLKMNEAKFQKRYTKIYDVLKSIPLELRTHYGVTEHMTQKDAIRDIRRLDKTDLVQIIDGIPDQVIIKYAKDYLRHKAHQVKDQIFLQQIDSLWKKITQKS